MMKNRSIMASMVIMITLIILMTGCQKEDLTKTTYALGTVITINLFDEGDDELMTRLIERVTEIEKLMSAQQGTSEISAVTAMAGKAPVLVSEETFEVIKRALYYAELSDGKFDPTIGPVISLWNIGTEEARLPEQSEIDAALKYVDYTKVVLNEEDQSVYLPEEGMSLDLGGIAKGYAADEVAKILDQEGVDKAMINLGGNVYAYGIKDSKEPWKVAVQTPYDTRSTYFGYVELVNKTVVTSGPYERYFEEDGEIYHHIFDATTGYPVKGETVSVSIIAENSMDADALSTLLFTMTPEEGLELIESMSDIECIYVDYEYGLKLSSGLIDDFTISDEKYQME